MTQHSCPYASIYPSRCRLSYVVGWNGDLKMAWDFRLSSLIQKLFPKPVRSAKYLRVTGGFPNKERHLLRVGTIKPGMELNKRPFKSLAYLHMKRLRYKTEMGIAKYTVSETCLKAAQPQKERKLVVKIWRELNIWRGKKGKKGHEKIEESVDNGMLLVI